MAAFSIPDASSRCLVRYTDAVGRPRGLSDDLEVVRLASLSGLQGKERAHYSLEDKVQLV